MSREKESKRGSSEPQLGIDYIVDHYSILGVPHDADSGLIKKAARAKLQLYHPDKVAHLAPEFKARAESQTRLLNEASSTLSDPDRRRSFDEQFNQWDGPVSKTGIPVVDISRPRASLHLMLDPEGARQDLENILSQARQMSGYNPTIFNFIEQQYKATPNPPSDLEQAYREALAKRDLDLSLQESFRRDHIGLSSRDATHSSPPRNYFENTKAHIDQGREQHTAIVEHTLLQIHRGEIHLLEGDTTRTDNISTDNQALTEYKQRALKQYDAHAAEIENIAEQREANMSRRLQLVRGEYHPDQKELSDQLLVSLGTKEKSHWFSFKLEGNSIKDEELPADVEEQMADSERTKTILDSGVNIMHIEHQEGLPFLDELQEGVTKHYEALEQAKKAKDNK